jgi:hypothetical protein
MYLHPAQQQKKKQKKKKGKGNYGFKRFEKYNKQIQQGDYI